MDRAFASGSSGTPPSAPGSPSIGYPTAGNPGTGTPATKPGPYWYHMITEELRAIVAAAGLTPAQGDTTQVLQAIQSGKLALGIGYMHVRDEKSSGTAGGSSIAGTQTRTLNTVVSNTISGASLGSNQITLPAGTYRISGQAPAADTQFARGFLYNVTDAANALVGPGENGTQSSGVDAVVVRSAFRGRLVLAAQKVFEIRQYTQVAITTSGLGTAVSNGGNEVFSDIEIIKES